MLAVHSVLRFMPDVVFCVTSLVLISLQRVWDELDSWRSRLMLLESEVQDLAEDHPDKAQVLMDQLTEPLQLYQNTAQMAEQRTVFLSKVRLLRLTSTFALQQDLKLDSHETFSVLDPCLSAGV